MFTTPRLLYAQLHPTAQHQFLHNYKTSKYISHLTKHCTLISQNRIQGRLSALKREHQITIACTLEFGSAICNHRQTLTTQQVAVTQNVAVIIYQQIQLLHNNNIYMKTGFNCFQISINSKKDTSSRVLLCCGPEPSFGNVNTVNLNNQLE